MPESITVSITIDETELAKRTHSTCTMGDGDTNADDRLAEALFTVLVQHFGTSEKQMCDTLRRVCDYAGVDCT